MYFSRITLRDKIQYSPDFWKIFHAPYSLHQSIWELFADHADRKRDFIYRVDSNNSRPSILTVSKREPDPNTALWRVESKMYNPQIRSGMALAFMLRANPVLTKKNDQNKHSRHDVVMNLKASLKDDKSMKSDRKPLNLLAQMAGSAWLEKRSEKNGFSVNPDMVRVDGYRQHQFYKKKNRKEIRISTLDFSGQLTVTDPAQFLETLYNGIGPAKGFGCGLMLVRRV